MLNKTRTQSVCPNQMDQSNQLVRKKLRQTPGSSTFLSWDFFNLLMKELFKILRTEKMDVTLMDCDETFKLFLRKIGFQQYIQKFLHPEWGLTLPVVMYNRDEDYFEALESPLYPICRFFNRVPPQLSQGFNCI